MTQAAKAHDLNDLAQQGDLPHDPAAKATPVNAKAAELADEAARVHTLQHLLYLGLERAKTPQADRSVITTGHWRMDRDTGGIRKGYAWVFAAETNWGKTNWLVARADENLRLGHRVLIVAVEDPPDLYGARLLARRANLSAQNAERGCLTQEEFDAAVTAVSQAKAEPVMLDARDHSVEWAVSRAKRLILSEKIDLVLFDYLHAFDNEKPLGKAVDRRLQINYIFRTLKGLIQSTNTAGVVFSQITEEAGKKPNKYSIRDSKDVANAAEVVALGWSPDTDQVAKDGTVVAKSGERCIILGKNKSGPANKLYEAPWDEKGAYFKQALDPNVRDYSNDFGPSDYDFEDVSR